jgi:hypothetical protein
MLYLLLSFPLGIFYLVFLVTGYSLGISLTLIWVGLLVLALTLIISRGLANFERKLANVLLNQNIPARKANQTGGLSRWQKIKVMLKDPSLWKGQLFLLVKFPLGVVSFVVLTTLLVLSIALITTPFYYHVAPPMVDFSFNGLPWAANIRVDTLGKALECTLLGCFCMLGSMHLFNGLAWISGWFARRLLWPANWIA